MLLKRARSSWICIGKRNSLFFKF